MAVSRREFDHPLTLVALLYVKLLEMEIKHGVNRAYSKIVEESPDIRGRILLIELAGRRLQRINKPTSEY